MAIKRFFIDSNEILSPAPLITGPEAHHMAGVFRLKPKDHILLVDGTGMEYEAEILTCAKNQVQVSILRQYEPPTESPVHITVGQGYLKDKKMDMLVRHLTELGISGWMPVITEFSVPNPARKKTDARIERWKIIAREAVKQSERTRLPEILPPLSFEEAIRAVKDTDIKIIFNENESGPLNISTAAAAADVSRPSAVFILLGPEGGLSPGEIALAKAQNFVSASLGPRILRAETASIAACTLIQHLFGDMC